MEAEVELLREVTHEIVLLLGVLTQSHLFKQTLCVSWAIITCSMFKSISIHLLYNSIALQCSTF